MLTRLRATVFILAIIVVSILLFGTEKTTFASTNKLTTAQSTSGFAIISVAVEHACAIMTDQTVKCWGENSYGQSNPPGGSFKSITNSRRNSCGLTTDNRIMCWGKDANTFQTDEQFKEIGLGDFDICGLRFDGTVTCWTESTRTSLSGKNRFNTISVGHYHGCGIKTDNTVACWGNNGQGRTIPPSGTFKQISAGDNNTCGVELTTALFVGALIGMAVQIHPRDCSSR